MAPRQELRKTEMRSERMAILLATYNGEKHLDEQIRSLFAQTYRNFVIIARDDGSSDQTPAILARWAAENPDRMIVVSDERGNLGGRDNFSLLMECCEYPYFAFCGQDDIWMPHKLEVSMRAIQQMESRFGSTTPILVNSDVTIVDHSLQEISHSYFAYKGVDITRDSRLDRLLFNNVVVGCSLTANRALLELATPVPQDFSYEDWWVTLVAASCGIIHTVLEPTVLYRQHHGNQVGVGPSRRRSTLPRILWDGRHLLQQPPLLRMRISKAWRDIHASAALLLRAVTTEMPQRNRDFLQAFCLPLLSDEVAAMPWSRRALLYARFLAIHVRQFPVAFRYCC